MNRILTKIIVGAVLTVLISVKAYAAPSAWGSYNSTYTDFVVFTDNNNATFTGYAYLFLLNVAGDQVTWNGTSWNLNGAQQVSYSAAGTLDGGSIPGTWGSDGETLPDSLLFGTRQYQAILTTATGNALLTSVASGYWAPTAPDLMDKYFNGTFNPQTSQNEGKFGSLAWQTTSASWAPVAAIPEPTTMALFGLGGLALVIRRKMRKDA